MYTKSKGLLIMVQYVLNMETEENQTITKWKQVRLPENLIETIEEKRIWKKEPYYSIIERLIKEEKK